MSWYVTCHPITEVPVLEVNGEYVAVEQDKLVDLLNGDIDIGDIMLNNHINHEQQALHEQLERHHREKASCGLDVYKNR